MKQLLFSAQGRINRGAYWKGVILSLLGMIPVAIVCFAIAQIIPGETTADGGYSVNGAAAIPFVVVVLAYFVFAVWAGICLGIKRYHDRGKPGVWILIQFAPFIGPIWYFVEAGCLSGTPGPNPYGPDPLQRIAPMGTVAAV